jgi:hypothetical protein
MPSTRRVLFVLVVLAAASCGAPSLPTGPSGKVMPPSGGGKYQCKAVSGKTDPWLVEWDATQKARMQATSQGGVLLVKYSGCELEVLYGCERQGQYKLWPTTPASSTEYITSEDDVFAKLPIGALNLAAEFQQGDKWSLDYVVVGMRQASIAAIKREELSGDCTQATHYISGMAVGAYQLVSEARRKAGGGVTVYGAGAGASSGAAAGALRQDGKYEMCTGNDATADDPRCQAIVQLFLEPVVEGSAPQVVSGAGVAPVQPTTTSTPPAKSYYDSLASEGPPAPTTGGGAGASTQYKSDLEKAWAAVKKAVKGAGQERQLELYQRFLTDFPVENPYADKARKEVDRIDAELTKKAEADAKEAAKSAKLTAEKEKAELMRQAYETAKNATGSATEKLSMWQRFIQAYPGSDNPYLATAKRAIKQLGDGAAAVPDVQQPGTNLYWLRCPLGKTWNGSACTGDAKSMDWDSAKNACPSGYRLPTRQEFIELLGDYKENAGAAEGHCRKCSASSACDSMFPSDTGWYWSSSPYDGAHAYLVAFENGLLSWSVMGDGIKADLDVRCVRSGTGSPDQEKKQAAVSTNPAGGDEVQQPGTSLYWLRCPVGQTWSGSICTGDRKEMNWNAAKSACPSGYRLPSRQEFVDLLGGCDSDVTSGGSGNCKNCSESGNCSGMFPSDTGWYWSSSPHVGDYAWGALFATGYVGRSPVGGGNRARCVRSGP